MVRETPLELDETSNEKVPLSQLMGKYEVACPVCGNKLSVDTKEMVMDGQTFFVCKKCLTTKG